MKKLLIPLSLMTIAMIPTGCTNVEKTESNVAKTLSDNLTQMIESVNKVSDIDENKLAIEEISKTTDVNKDYKKQNVNNYRRHINRSLLKTPKTDKNGTTSYYNRNATFRKSTYGGKNTALNGNKTTNLDNKTTNSVDNISYPNINSNNGNYVTDGATDTNRYYTAKYTPRYTNTMTSSNATLTNYIEKIQDLYTICNDTCAASYELEDLKAEIVDSCNNCKNLADKVNNGEIMLTNSQKKTLEEYNKTLQSCINDLNGCKSCQGDVDMISSLKGNFSNNCDTLVAKYLKVLNNLDTNTSICNNARCTVAEVNNYIASICGESKVNTYNRYDRFYEIDKDFSVDTKTTEINNTNNATNTQQNQNSATNSQATNKANSTTQSANKNNQNATTQTTTNNNTNSYTTPVTTPTNVAKPVVNQSGQYNGINQYGQNKANSQAENKVDNVATSTQNNQVNNTQKPTTYPMPRPAQNTTTNQYAPNRHPLTKDIKENPNINKTFTQNNFGTTTQQSSATYDSVKNTATPAPKTYHQGIATNGRNANNTLYRSNSQRIQNKPTFSSQRLMMFGPNNVRAGKDIMTLEEI